MADRSTIYDILFNRIEKNIRPQGGRPAWLGAVNVVPTEADVRLAESKMTGRPVDVNSTAAAFYAPVANRYVFPATVDKGSPLTPEQITIHEFTHNMQHIPRIPERDSLMAALSGTPLWGNEIPPHEKMAYLIQERPQDFWAAIDPKKRDSIISMPTGRYAFQDMPQSKAKEVVKYNPGNKYYEDMIKKIQQYMAKAVKNTEETELSGTQISTPYETRKLRMFIDNLENGTSDSTWIPGTREFFKYPKGR